MLYVVIGPPTAGKTTWVLERATTNDVVIDDERLAVALAGRGVDGHNHTPAVKAVVKQARLAAIDTAIGHAHDVDVYVIHSRPGASTMARYRKLGAEIVVIDPGRSVVEARCKKERPWQMGIAVKAWYESDAALYRQYRHTGGIEQAAAAPSAGTAHTSRHW